MDLVHKSLIESGEHRSLAKTASSLGCKIPVAQHRVHRGAIGQSLELPRQTEACSGCGTGKREASTIVAAYHRHVSGLGAWVCVNVFNHLLGLGIDRQAFELRDRESKKDDDFTNPRRPVVQLYPGIKYDKHSLSCDGIGSSSGFRVDSVRNLC